MVSQNFAKWSAIFVELILSPKEYANTYIIYVYCNQNIYVYLYIDKLRTRGINKCLFVGYSCRSRVNTNT